MSNSTTSSPWRANLERIWRRIFEQRWLNLGLRAKMGFLIEIGLIGIFGVFILLGASTARQSTLRILNERVMLARLSAANLDASLRHVNSVMEITAQREVWHGADQSDQDRFAAVGDAFDQVARTTQGVYLLDAAGEEIYSASYGDLGLDWSALRGKAVAHSPMVYELPSGVPWAVIMVPLQDENGQSFGWLATVLDFGNADLAPFQNTIDLGESGTLDLVNADGRVLVTSHVDHPMEPGTVESVRELFFGGEPGVETCLGCSDLDTPESGDEVIAFAPLTQAPWGVIVRQQASELMAPVNRLLIQTIIVGLATVLGALALVWVTTNSVIQPVQKLNEAVNRIANGDLTTPMEVLVSDWFTGRRLRKDEIGALANNFETMRRQLKLSMDETQALNRELDERVKERTAALIYRNQELSILNAVAITVNQSLKLEDILDRALEAVLRLTEVDMGAVFLFEELQGALRMMAYRGMSPEAAQVAANLGLMDSSCGGVMDHSRVVIVPDISHYKGVRARSLQREGVNTLVHVPLTAKGCVLGSMCVGTRREREFADEEQNLLQAIGSQIAVAIENARLYAEVQQKERMRGELFKKAINAQEDERKRIARELHDETSQSLTALLFAAEEAGQMKGVSAVRKRVDGMRELIQHTLDGVHKLIFDLRPSILDHLGLVPAIRRLAKSRLEAKGVRVWIEGNGLTERLSPEMETALFRVLQEAMTNIARHSAARNVWIACWIEDTCVHLEVKDDGVGFDLIDLTISPESLRGLGLLGMQERLEVIGGNMQILSTPGSGTIIDISVPRMAGAHD